ncbi:uncharacterized protein LOC131597520 [Vicia villosa]|uniref:uncharacterized protein LOC131597520 n=1 Tax=Vicia villosa TaxID=3911 RepID=UPI00273ADB47|nr:uncharacterized protein LOC131597520 [Vicia villosa]
MNHQQQEAFKFSQEYERSLNRSRSSSTVAPSTTTISPSSSTVRVPSSTVHPSSLTMPVIDENHLTQKPNQINFNIPIHKLTVLWENMVDFENLAAIGHDLRPTIHTQGWKHFFERLYGPVFENLVKDFWIQADCDNLHVVSYVLGQKIVITKKSIAGLLGMEHLVRKRVYGMDKKSLFVRRTLSRTIYKTYSPEKEEYKFMDLFDDLRIWLKIILGCINPRPSTSSSDYFNVDQKVIMFYIMINQKLFLPYILFNYLRNSITKIRKYINSTKKMPTYIPFGRLLFDIFVESSLIDYLTKEVKFTEDLESNIGESFNAKTLKSMRMMKEIGTTPFMVPDVNTIERIYLVEHFLLFTTGENPICVAQHVIMVAAEGNDLSCFRYEDMAEADIPYKGEISLNNEIPTSSNALNLLKFAFFNKESSSGHKPPFEEEIPQKTNFETLETLVSEPLTTPESVGLSKQNSTTQKVPESLQPSEPSSNSSLIIYEKPLPKTLDECVNLFRNKVMKMYSSLRAKAVTSTNPQDLDNFWVMFKKWMSSEFERLIDFSQMTRIVDVHLVTKRKEAEEWVRAFELLAAKQRASKDIKAGEATLKALQDAEEDMLRKANKEEATKAK